MKKADAYGCGRLILNTEKEITARAILSRLQKTLDFSTESLSPYHKGGFESQIRFHLEGDSWSEKVISMISLAQTLGRSWVMSGDIKHELDISSAELTDSGVNFISLTLTRSAT